MEYASVGSMNWDPVEYKSPICHTTNRAARQISLIAGRIVSNWIRAFARELVKDATTMAVGSPAASPSPNPKPRQQAA